MRVEMFAKKEYEVVYMVRSDRQIRHVRHHFLQGVLDYTHTPLVAANVQHTASRSSLGRIFVTSILSEGIWLSLKKRAEKAEPVKRLIEDYEDRLAQVEIVREDAEPRRRVAQESWEQIELCGALCLTTPPSPYWRWRRFPVNVSPFLLVPSHGTPHRSFLTAF